MNAKFAYFLGWMYSDGCISFDSRCNSIVTKIKLIKSDEKTLRLFSDITDWNFSYEKDKYVCMRKNSIELGNLLMSHGVYPRKSYENCLKVKRPSTISDENMPYFIRGYYEGNGTFAWSNKNTFMLECNCCGKCINLLNDFMHYFALHNIKCSISSTRKDFYWLRIRTREDVKRFIELIYSDELSLVLDRKYKIVREFLDNYHTTRELQSIACKKHPSQFLRPEVHKKAMDTRKRNFLSGVTKPSMLGKHHSEETKRKISKANKKAHLVHAK